jgi:Arc/MetJ family transcription regulator
MRTTLDLPEDIITEGLKVTHIRTKTELITTAVRELIRKHKTSALKKFKGTIDLNINLNALRDRP